MYVICELAKYLPKSNCFFFVCHAFAFWHAHADCECLIMSNNSFGCTLQIAVIQSEAHDFASSPFSLFPSGPFADQCQPQTQISVSNIACEKSKVALCSQPRLASLAARVRLI